MAKRKKKRRKSRMSAPVGVFKIYSNKRLSKFLPVEDGDMVECLRCGKDHVLRSAVCIHTGRRDSLFLIYKCRDNWEFGAIFGRMVANRRPDNWKPHSR